MATYNFSTQSFLIRFVFALILIFSTYNPSEYSYYHWLRDLLPGYSPAMVFCGVVLLIGWTIFLRATARSLGLVGLILAVAFFGTLLWMIIDQGWVSVNNITAITYLILVLLSMVMATGLSWSHLRRRLTGQVDVDDTEDD